MSLIFSIILWAAIILVAVHFAKIVIGITIWFVIGVVWLVALPFVWGYKKLNKENE